MAEPKLFPTRLYELKRLRRDRRDDRLWTTSAGQAEYWSNLGERCQQDSMLHLLESVLHLPGDVIECGVYRGSSLLKLGHVIREKADHKHIFALDSFQGFPTEKVTKVDVGFLRRLGNLRKKFRLCNDTPDRLRRYFETFGIQGEVVKGYFSETLPRFANQQFCFIHVDCDIYESHLECLEALYENLSPGGVIVLDDYSTEKWPGATKAIDEFFAGRVEEVQRCTQRVEASWYIRKSAVSQRAAG